MLFLLKSVTAALIINETLSHTLRHPESQSGQAEKAKYISKQQNGGWYDEKINQGH